MLWWDVYKCAMRKILTILISIYLSAGSAFSIQISGNLITSAPIDLELYDVLGKQVLAVKIKGSGQFVSDRVDIVPDVYVLKIGTVREFIFLDNSDITINGSIDASNPKKSNLEFGGIEANDRFQLILNKYIKGNLDGEILKPYIAGNKIDPRASTAFYCAAVLPLKKPAYTFEPAHAALGLMPENVEKNASYKWLSDIVDSLKNYAIGTPVPDFTLEDVNGKKVSLSDFKGKYVVLDFWASWCGPCIREIRAMKEFYPEFQDNKDIVFISASMDDTKETWMNGLKMTQIPWISLWEYEKPGQIRTNWFNYTKIKDDYGFRTIPFVILIDKGGNYLERGIHADKLKKRLNDLLNK